MGDHVLKITLRVFAAQRATNHKTVLGVEVVEQAVMLNATLAKLSSLSMRLEMMAIRPAFRDTKRSVVLQEIRNLVHALVDVSNSYYLYYVNLCTFGPFLQPAMQIRVLLHTS